jgi:UDP-2,3-diacylglucosamine pyrophosphatase LpxH
MANKHERIWQSLQRLKDSITVKESAGIKKLKLIAFSDHHRGQDDGADDFRPCKAVYHAALGYYLEAGFTLYLLGDVEELWECQPKKPLETYRDTLELEQQFVRQGRYKRLWGNHDDEWQYQNQVERFLKTYITNEGETPVVSEGAIITVTSKGRPIGELFFIHGHQGTLESDRFAWLSRLAVRYLWRPFQRLTRIKPPTPKRDFNLRLDQEVALHAWANQQQGLILISGHNHHPVFSSISHEDRLKCKIEELKQRLDATKNTAARQKLQQDINEKSAQLNWVLAKSDGVVLEIPKEQKPCYFNTGCCSFPDGDITGIEIEDGKIRLVRWPDDDGNPRKKILQEADLKEIFRLCV